MRLSYLFGFAFLFAFVMLVTPGCGGGSGEPEVAPRTAEEVEAFKAEVYGAEEEMDAEAEDE
jgi:hypothetical protein